MFYETQPAVAYVGEHSETLVESTLDLLAYDTQNPPGRTRDIVEWLAEQFSTLGIDHECFFVDPAKPNVLATIPGESDQTLLYNGHLDTVPVDHGMWDHDPLGERDGDRIYGRGATDMKGPVAAMIQTARAFAVTDTTPPITLRFAFVSDEEVGGEAGITALLDNNRLTPDACLIGESTCTPDRHSITVADRGYIWLTLEATGEPAHGSRPVFGENAIDVLYDALTTCRERLTGRPLSIDPPMERVLDETIQYYSSQLDEPTARRLFDRPTVNLGKLEGGEAVNSVPPTASARLDVRLTAGVHPTEVLSEIRECIRSHDHVRITDTSWTAGTYTDPDAPFVNAVADVAEDVLAEQMYRRSATGSGDAQKFRTTGIPTVEFAPGTGTAHAADEYTTTTALSQIAQIYTRLPYALETDAQTPTGEQ